ncbi:MAG: phosphoenolpyruvate--protein phosphotransferase [Pseudomonadota bacterium]
MPHSFSAPRLLMNRLRQMMAAGHETRDRLDKTVQLIAGTMVADVCSIYLRTKTDELELVATEGLRREAVFSTKLAMDEGLVGQIALTAQPLAIQDAPRHPAFSYRPETGEDPYHAFLGVPILRGGRVIGVLTVQNRTERAYGEDEIESLQTIAMVLAELAVAVTDEVGDRISLRGRRAARMSGRVLCGGIGFGEIRFHDPEVPAAKFFAEDQSREISRLGKALRTLRLNVDSMVTIDSGALMGEPRDVLETYRLLAHDPAWTERLMDAVDGGLTAEAAIDRARREHRARLETATDPYIRERLYDLEDLDNRLLRILSGNETLKAEIADGDVVLVARRLGPADLLEYRESGLKGILIEDASVSSHAAIVARAMGIPTLGGLPGLTTALEGGDKVIVDAEDGALHLRPDEAVSNAYRNKVALSSEREERYAALRDEPARSLDGVDVRLMLNAGLQLDLDHLQTTGADGVGLFRTEFQFLVAESMPLLGEQVKFYHDAYERARGKPVIFRTVDLGGDKMLPNLNQEREENPALGWRSIRFALDSKGFFRRQLRALLRASTGRPLWIMFPMITVAEEFFEAKALLLDELAWSEARGHDGPSELHIGAMLETPSFGFALKEVCAEVDFISIGTNDLLQFFFAADRMTPKVADRYDLLSRPALRFLQHVAETCDTLGIPASICGEATGHPANALCLIALGYRQLSMPASSIGPVKFALRSANIADIRHTLCKQLDQGTGDLRKEVLAMFRDTHGSDAFH